MKKGLCLLLMIGCLVTGATGAFAQAEGQRPDTAYIGVAQTDLAIRVEMSREAEAVGYCKTGDRVEIVRYEPSWLLVVQGSGDSWVTGYVLRHMVWDINPVGETALPYGAMPACYHATVSSAAPLLAEPDAGGEVLWRLTKGSRIAILEIEDGWAKVVYWRTYGYFSLDAVDGLTPVYDAHTAQAGDCLGAFVSFYSVDQEGLNPNRIVNIAQACGYISMELSPGFEFSFNAVAGPYQPSRGYLSALSLYEGETVPSFGGGTCQVSSTLYNVLLPLHEGMSILYRRPHGASGAAYLPHGVDAAVGNETIDLIFRNDYPFAVRIEASAQDGVLFVALHRV